jgi:hypothetical protein
MKRMIFAVCAMLAVLSGCAFNAKDFLSKENVLNGPGISVGMSSQDVYARGYVCLPKVTSTSGEVDQCATPEARDKYGYDDYGNADPMLGGYGITVGLNSDGKVVSVQQE